MEASSSSLRAFSTRSKAARVALLAASETGSRSAIFLLTSYSSTSNQRCDIVRANAALPQGLALLAERFHRRPALLSALLGHGGHAGRALVQALAAGLAPASASPSSPGCRPPPPGTCRRAHQQSAAPARVLPERARRAGGPPLPERLPLQRLGINGGLQHRPQLLAALQDVGGHSEFFFTEQKKGTLEKVAPHADL